MIGGNKKALLQCKTITKDEIGSPVEDWLTVDTLTGFLDFMSGGADVTNYNAKIQESTHVWIMDYKPIEVTEAQARLLIDDKEYEITLIDNPMELNKHIEIYLKYTGV